MYYFSISVALIFNIVRFVAIFDLFVYFDLFKYFQLR